jgi:acetyl esterase/lipase
MISNQAQDFWTLLKTYPKQIEMPLSQAREADTHAEDFTSEPQPLASPVFADLTGLPPLLYVAGGDEMLLDDSIRLVRNAGTAGIDATLFIAAGMQHVFAIWAGAFPEADAAIALIGNWVRRLPLASH